MLSILLSKLFFYSCTDNKMVKNAGIEGNSTVDLLERIDSDVINHHPDLVIVMVGTNDMLNHEKMISYEEYSVNLTKIVERFEKENIQVLLLSPPTVDNIYLLERYDKELFQGTPNQRIDSISRIMEKISVDKNIGFIDFYKLFTEKGIPNHNKDTWIQNVKNSGERDGLHPTSLGYSFIANEIFTYLKTNEILKENIKIICFGDSITYGTRVRGSGTAWGKSYPAQLLSLIKVEFASKK